MAVSFPDRMTERFLRTVDLISTWSGKLFAWLILVLTLVVSISFFLIADIDSPRGGIIRVRPQNLVSLSQSLHPQ